MKKRKKICFAILSGPVFKTNGSSLYGVLAVSSKKDLGEYFRKKK